MICQGTAFDIFFSPWHAHIGAPPPGYPPAPYGAPPPHGEQPNDGVDVCSSAQLSTILLAFIWCAPPPGYPPAPFGAPPPAYGAPPPGYPPAPCSIQGRTYRKLHLRSASARCCSITSQDWPLPYAAAWEGIGDISSFLIPAVGAPPALWRLHFRSH
eukprot:1161595-Pelagomonas_calceolata.AAC.3